MMPRLVGWVQERRVEVPLGQLVRLGSHPENEVVLRVEGVSRLHARVERLDDAYFIEDLGSRNGTLINGERVARAELRHLDVIRLGSAELLFLNTNAKAAAAPAPARASEPKPPAAGKRGPEPAKNPHQGQPREGRLPPEVIAFREVGPPASRVIDADEQPTDRLPNVPGTDDDAAAAEPPIIGVRLSGDRGVFTLSLGRSVIGRAVGSQVWLDSREVSRAHAFIDVSHAHAFVEDNRSANGTAVNGSRITTARRLVSGDRILFAEFEFRVELLWLEGGD
jgi:pSer/pThr/pTyr-binding forkhead associated (FHA) protein